MTTSSLQDGINEAGSPVDLLWRPDDAPWTPPVVAPEHAGWRQEQHAWHTTVALFDLSHHMSDTAVEGPDATRLLSEVSANDYRDFALGRAKQFVPVAPDGNIITDGILLREAERRYLLSGVPAAQNWVRYHGANGGYDVEFSTDPDSRHRGGPPKLFRYQVQGPLAGELVAAVLGGPLPPVRFFHSTPVELGGRRFRALRHGMAGQPGFEFFGEWEHGAAVEEALLRAGERFGLVRVGGLAYPTASMDSGWIPSPTPAIYTAPELAGYREHLPLRSYEGARPLTGGFFSRDIEDHYCTPYELGYGRSISFDHEFIGRDALLKAKDDVRRTKVTLAFDPADVRAVLGGGFVHGYARNRVEVGGALVGVTHQTDSADPAGTVLALALIDREHARPGTEVQVSWGAHPGPGTDPDAELGFPRIRATVHPAPYGEHARTRYRLNP